MKSIFKILGVVAIFALALSACSSPTPSAPPVETPSETHAGEDMHEGEMHEEGEMHHEEGEGHGDGEMHEHENVAEPIPGAERIYVEAGEFYFKPAEFHFHVGDTVNFVVENLGLIEHEFAIRELDFELAHFLPGQTAAGGITFTRAGTYTIGCYLPGHFEAGMKATLVVEEAH